MTRALLVVLLVAAAGGRAEAQECVGGRVPAGDECCWPGQTWDESHGCVGAPRCPETHDPVSRSCVRRSRPGFTGEPVRVGRDAGLLAAGALLFFPSYATAASLSFVWARGGDVVSLWYLGLLPFGHPFAAILDGMWWGEIVAQGTLALAEVVGVILLAVGSRVRAVEDDAPIELVPTASGADVGLTLVVRE